MGERLLSQLAHVEVLTSTPEESLHFYTQVLGLEESGRHGQSVFLRGWGEFFHHSIQLTEGPHAGLGHVAWRTQGPGELERAVAALEQTGQGEGWYDETPGHGPAYRYRAPHGQHLHEVFWRSSVTRRRPRRLRCSPTGRSATRRAAPRCARWTT